MMGHLIGLFTHWGMIFEVTHFLAKTTADKVCLVLAVVLLLGIFIAICWRMARGPFYAQAWARSVTTKSRSSQGTRTEVLKAVGVRFR